MRHWGGGGGGGRLFDQWVLHVTPLVLNVSDSCVSVCSLCVVCVVCGVCYVWGLLCISVCSLCVYVCVYV